MIKAIVYLLTSCRDVLLLVISELHWEEERKTTIGSLSSRVFPATHITTVLVRQQKEGEQQTPT